MLETYSKSFIFLSSLPPHTTLHREPSEIEVPAATDCHGDHEQVTPLCQAENRFIARPRGPEPPRPPRLVQWDPVCKVERIEPYCIKSIQKQCYSRAPLSLCKEDVRPPQLHGDSLVLWGYGSATAFDEDFNAEEARAEDPRNPLHW